MNKEIYKMNFRLAEPISISFHKFTHSENTLLALKNSILGYGEAAPFNPITGDTQEDNFSLLRKISDIPERRINLDSIPDFLPKASATSKAAVDMALHDIIGKREGVPVFKLYSRKKSLVPNTITIGINSIENTRKKASEILATHPHIKALKIKLQGNSEDLARVEAVKSVCSSHIKFTLDANKGFNDKNAAIDVLNKIRDAAGNILLVEEPYNFKDAKELKTIRDNIDIPLFVDESVKTVGDVRHFIECDSIDGINIKIQKMGGILHSKEIAETAIQNRTQLIVGCMLESPISISAGLHFAVSTKNVIVTDLDSDLHLPNCFTGRPFFRDGTRIPCETHGLGVEPDIAKLKDFASREDLVFEPVK